jgi:polyisoprenoid-binding protein YceI
LAPTVSRIEGSAAGASCLVAAAAHARLGFTARHAMVTRVRGQSREFEDSGHLDEHPAKTWAEVRITSTL